MTESRPDKLRRNLVCCGALLLLSAWAGAAAFEGLDGPQRPPTRVEAKVGGHATFNCELDFPQEVEIPYILNWTKEDQEIFSSHEGSTYSSDEFLGRIQLLDRGLRGFGRGSINLTSIRETDSGWYGCRVLFPNRSPITRNNGTWFHLEVEGGNLIRIPPVNQTTMEGKEAKFQCATKPGDSFLKWYKDGEPISSIGDLSRRSSVGQDGSLTIDPTDMTDLGDYTCEVVNSIGDRQTAKASLNVQYKAKVIYTPKELYLPYGRSAVLDCHFRANPPLSNLRWEKDGFLFDPYNVPGVFYRRNGSLFFSKVDEAHAGHYTCTPYNELGSTGTSPKINVIVQRSPVFTVTPHSLYLRRLGDSISFPCDAVDSEANHRPTIIWTRMDGAPLPEGRYQLIGGNLTIDSIEESDRGLYQCSASNEAASLATNTELIIENLPPRAPYNVSATSGVQSLTVRWMPATSTLPLPYPYDGPHEDDPWRNEYRDQVWYRRTDLMEWKSVRVSSPGVNEVTLNNLMPGMEYQLMVYSPNRFGEGMFSKTIVSRTKGNIDEDFSSTTYPLASNGLMGPPRDLGIHLTTEGYLLEWLPPLHGRDLLRIYIVRWSRGTEEFLLGTAETKNNYYLIEDLEEDEVYHFQVVGLTTNDVQVISSKVSIHVPAYGRIRGAVAGVACVVLLILAGALFWFSRHKLAPKEDATENGNKAKSNGDR